MAADKTCPNCRSRLPAATVMCPMCGMEQPAPGAHRAWQPQRERRGSGAALGVIALIVLLGAAAFAFVITRKKDGDKKKPPVTFVPEDPVETPQGLGAVPRERVNDPDGVKDPRVPPPPPDPVGPTGIVECDRFLAEFKRCAESRDQSMRDALMQSFDAMTQSFTQLRDMSPTQAVDTCKMIDEQMKTALESLGCKQP